MRTPGDSAMLCRFAHVQSVTFFAHAVVCTVILRRGRGSATFEPDRSRHTRTTSVEGAGGPAGPGRASSRRAEPSARGADGERAGGPVGTRNTGDAATTSVSEGGGRAGCSRHTRAASVEGAEGPGCIPGWLRAAAGPGRASRSTTPSRRLACGDLAGGPPPSGTKTGSPGPEGTANPDGERAVDPTAPGVPVTQPRPRRYKTRARHSTEYRARRRL